MMLISDKSTLIPCKGYTSSFRHYLMECVTLILSWSRQGYFIRKSSPGVPYMGLYLPLGTLQSSFIPLIGTWRVGAIDQLHMGPSSEDILAGDSKPANFCKWYPSRYVSDLYNHILQSSNIHQIESCRNHTMTNFTTHIFIATFILISVPLENSWYLKITLNNLLNYHSNITSINKQFILVALCISQ